MAGADVRIIERTDRVADVNGIDNHAVKNLPICTVAGIIVTNQGPVVAILHQFAYLGKGSTIISSAQIEAYKNRCDDRSLKVGGTQRITTLDGYVIPLCIRNGLPYMAMHPPTDDELESFPHVVLTSDVHWDPSLLDHDPTMDPTWPAEVVADDVPPYDDDRFTATGEYRDRTVAHMQTTLPAVFASPHDPGLDDVIDTTILATQQHKVTVKDRDYESLRRFFAFAPADIVAATFNATTAYARSTHTIPLRRHFMSRFPALNVHRRHEPVATDTVFSDTPAVDDGATFAQLFVGRNSLVTDVYPMKSIKQFVNTLEDNVRKRGAMDKLVSDRAQLEISGRVHDFLRSYCIDDWQSEPHHQWQNFAENRWQTVKTYTNNVLNHTGAPSSVWLLCLTWVCYVLNHTAVASLNFRTPMEALTGVTPDISAMLHFTFWEPVYYLDPGDELSFPSSPHEKLGRFVGIAENVGDALTFKILTIQRRFSFAALSVLP